MSVSTTVLPLLRSIETLTGGQTGVATPPSQTIQLTTANSVLTSSSTPAVSKVWSGTVTLSAGAATLNLASLPRDNELEPVDLTGLKVQAIHMKGGANSAIVEADVGASNGYNFLGDADSHVCIAASKELLVTYNETLPDVAAGARTIDFASADVDATVQVHIVAG
jgi:hypothetical protein